ncbi:Pls/PosA family non-ribosomal peptide synthetase [Corynebacterium sp.]|uniref:Pls/PosA family non-ribosomal peptide synthetase n=1 Tax=Corynebacterium sp. TaxID=1720 RepID=UPI0026DD069C|nr:Pls/PosA family non-ribosomal peptide synthetase [Corynebacterium sp.]MDO5076858.1 amino acid adenylation domain-containing protein [Corynebacterium sp.]
MGLSRIPSQFLRSAEAAENSTLVDILRHTATTHPQAPAIDDGDILTYAELWDAVTEQASQLHEAGIRRGDRIGIRMPSGSKDLYVAILATLVAGAAYVPVDVDDPAERAELVFSEARVNAVIGAAGTEVLHTTAGGDTRHPRPSDDAWIIFTSGSTGTPKGVAVSHRSAAAFVEAERRLFLRHAPLNTEDRVLAGLSVAFDASCEEMWLAWANGACLVPAPRSLVRSGMDLGPWLIRRNITVVSTVPTLAGLWPAEALDAVRLLIFGGEACPAELVDRVATPDREVWNTYGPTEATVVACAARVHAGQPVSIGLPLQGWDLAVVDTQGEPVAVGETGELVIGGVGLARYLDDAKNKERFAPLRSVGWARAYRSGDHVRLEEDGLYFVGRVDDQVKIGGRRIELGEVETHVSALSNVRSASVVAQSNAGGNTMLVGYLSLERPEDGFDADEAHAELAAAMPAALVPRLHVMDELPVTTAGKVDKRALPWPLPSAEVSATGLNETQQWLAEIWVSVLGVAVTDINADFFSLGGTSLAAATAVAHIRQRYPSISVRDLYDHPRLEALAERISQETTAHVTERTVAPVPAQARLVQGLVQLGAMTWSGAIWVTWIMLAAAILGHGPEWTVVAAAVLVFLTPLGRLALAAVAIRALMHNITPGDYPRGGNVHLRIWAAERVADVSGVRATSLSTLMPLFGRLTGCHIGRGVDLHSAPPVTGMLFLDNYCAIEPEVDLSGYWIDGDIVHVGAIRVGTSARVGTRTVLMPGTVVGANAQVEPGSTVQGTLKAGTRWAGSPAVKIGRTNSRFPDAVPPRKPIWAAWYTVSSLVIGLLPISALAGGMWAAYWATGSLLATGALGALIAFACYAAAVLLLVRVLSIRLTPGVQAVRSFQGWRVWSIVRLMDDARHHLFPLYASQLTPWWFRLLGARIGADAELSTALAIPALLEVRDGAFLADDTLVGGYSLGHGWLFTAPTRVGKRSFLGNSGVLVPGRKLGKESLIAVLSLTPKRAKARSNWWGSPPERLRRVATCDPGEARTYAPGFGVKVARASVETLRLLAPAASGTLAVGVTAAMYWVVQHYGWLAAYLASGLILIAAGALAAGITICVKWCCVGRIQAGEHPLWSRFVWLNELQDSFVEGLAAPWFSNHNLGTGALNWFLRGLGARIGAGAWVQSYWLPEADLCTIADAATVGPGCVVQTHLFQDRVMSLDTVTLAQGATLGPHSVALPASEIGQAATIGPRSLVMRGDRVPQYSAWLGNPIEPT